MLFKLAFNLEAKLRLTLNFKNLAGTVKRETEIERLKNGKVFGSCGLQ